MQKTCTVRQYLCTRKLDVELKFGVYEQVGKVGMVDSSECPVSGMVDFCNYSSRCFGVSADIVAKARIAGAYIVDK